MTHRPQRRHRTDHELDRQMAEHLVALSMALDEADNGVAAGFGMIATYLRPLLTDRALTRFAHDRQLERPSVAASQSPAEGDDVILSVELLPTSPTDPGKLNLPLDSWSQRVAIRVRTAGRAVTTMSWSQLAGEVANGAGAHLSRDVAEVFDHTRVLQMRGLTVERYALRQIGVVVEDALEQMLVDGLHHPLLPRHHRQGELHGAAPTWIVVRSNWRAPSGVAYQHGIEVAGSALNTDDFMFTYQADGVEMSAALSGRFRTRVVGPPPAGVGGDARSPTG